MRTSRPKRVRPGRETLVMSQRDFARFLQAIEAAEQPAEKAKRAATRFSRGRFVGSSYECPSSGHWPS